MPNGNKTNLDKIKNNSNINTVQSYAYWNVWDGGTLQDVDAFLKQASGLGLKVLLCLPFNSPDNNTPFINRNPPDYNIASQLIRHTISSPALYGYYFADEPCDTQNYQKNITPLNLKKAYNYFSNLIKSLGKKVPLIFADDFSLWDPKPYDNSADIVINDAYNIDNDIHWNKSLKKFDDLIVKTRPSVSKQSMIAVFSTGAAHRKNNLTQIRFQVYTSIIHGAKGIWFFSYKDSFDPPELNYTKPSEYFLKVISPVSAELKKIEQFLLLPDISGYISGVHSGLNIAPGNPDIEYIIRKKNTNYVVITANLSGEKITLNNQTGFNLNNLPGSNTILQCSLIGENKSLTIQNKIIADTYEPYSVHVYLLQP
jgi:hypothetical protein